MEGNFIMHLSNDFTATTNYVILKATTKGDKEIEVDELLTTKTEFIINKTLNKVDSENWQLELTKEKQMGKLHTLEINLKNFEKQLNEIKQREYKKNWIDKAYDYLKYALMLS